MSTRSALATLVVVLVLSLTAQLHTAAITPSPTAIGTLQAAAVAASDSPLQKPAPGASAERTIAHRTVGAQASKTSARHVWTDADLEHLPHRAPTPDPNLDRILARLAADQPKWYPAIEDYGGPVAISTPYRPAWQNAPWDWPTLRDRIDRGGPFTIDEDLTPVGLPLFGCWGCGGFPAHGRVLRGRVFRPDRERTASPVIRSPVAGQRPGRVGGRR